MHPLFREPLRFDVLTWLWWLLVSGVYLAHLRLDTWVSAWAFIVTGVVVASAFTLFVALVRYLVDGPQRRIEGARTMREVLGIDVLPGVGDWNRARPVTEPADEAPEVVLDEAPAPEPAPTVDVVASQPSAPPKAAPPEAGPLEAPRALRLEVSEVRIPAGRPVTLTWSLEGADSVVVDGRAGFPSHGQTTVAVRETRHVLVVGSNAAGVTAVTTPEIEVVPDVPAPAPVPTAAPAPERRGPSVHRLQIDLGATSAGSPSALAHLDRVLAAQDRLRAGAPALPATGVPDGFGRWLRGHPRARFVREGSYLRTLQPARPFADTSQQEAVAERTARSTPATAEDDRTTT